MRTDEEIRANQAKYERMLDEAFGLVPDQEPESPAQPFNPQPMPSIMPFDKVYGAFTSDPEVVALFREGWDDTLKPVDLGPMPGDATGQLRWYILRDLSRHHHARHKADFEDAKKFRTLQRVNALFKKLEQHDPLYKLTMDVMKFHLERLPASTQGAVDRMFARCPHETLGFYREIRQAAAKALNINHTRGKRAENRA